MNLEYMLVTFKQHRTVLIDDTPEGVTNRILLLPPGTYEVKLDGDGFVPPSQNVDLLGTSIMRPKVVPFS